MQHRLSLSLPELIVIRESIHSITIKASDAPLVGNLLEKIYKGIEKTSKEDGVDDASVPKSPKSTKSDSK
jgi:hypothetical protein